MSGQLFATDSLGGYFYSLNLSNKLRDALQNSCKFRQLCDAKDAGGRQKGQTFTWDVVSNLASRTSGSLSETNTVPEGNFTITQGTLTVAEYANSVPYTGKLEDLSKFDVQSPIMKVLNYDAMQTMDAAAFTQFNRTPLRATDLTATTIDLVTTGTATTTSSVAFNSTHHKLVIDTMKERNIPPFEGDDYVAVSHPTTLRAFKNNLESIHQYTETGLQMIFKGEVGRYENCRFIEQTNVPKGGIDNTDTTFNAFTGTANLWGVTGGGRSWIFFMGSDTVMEGVVIPEEIRSKIPTDFGRSKGVAWYALTGFGLVQTAAAEARIVKWASYA